MKKVFFDLATVTGWAAGTDRGVEGYGRLILPRTGDQYGQWLKAALYAFGQCLDNLKPDEVIYEQPVFPPQTELNTLRKLYPLGGALEMCCDERGIPCWEANLSDIRAHFLGHGRVPRGSKKIKAVTKVRCRERGWKPFDDNEADALAGLDYSIACDTPGFALRATPLFANA